MIEEAITDEAVLVSARTDAEAFTRFYRRHAAPVLGYLVRRTGDPELGADLTAETFACALEGLGTATGSESALALTAGTGRAGAWQVWLNGRHLGTVRTGTASGNQNSSATFPLDPSLLRAGEDNVVSVLVRNMGHNEDGGSNDNHKAPRGLLSASLTGSDAPLTWRIQGEAGLDPVRGSMNNGGLFGERAGWSLPGFRDRDWQTVSLPDRAGPAGIAWYRTRFSLHLPRHQDVPVGLRFGDDPQRHYRVLIFVNGWNLGQYINDVGPQHVFVLPEGILRAHGTNTLALAVWSDDAASAGLGDVGLEALANTVSPTNQER
jgi:hypothetical protein